MNPNINSHLTISIQKHQNSSHLYNFVKNMSSPHNKINQTISIIKRTSHSKLDQNELPSFQQNSLIKLSKISFHNPNQQHNYQIFPKNFVLPKICNKQSLHQELEKTLVSYEDSQYSKRKSQLLKRLLLISQNDQSLQNITLRNEDSVQPFNPSPKQIQGQSSIHKNKLFGKIQRRIYYEYLQNNKIKNPQSFDSDISEDRFSNSTNIEQQGYSITRKQITQRRRNK